MGRNFGGKFCYAFALVMLLIFQLEIIQGFKIEIPNYEILKNQKILTQNLEFPYEGGSLSQMQKSYRSGVMNLLNSNKQSKYMMLTFEMFMYPYRVYSYFDQYNKKQYIMKKINYVEFRENQHNKTKDSSDVKLSEPQSIFDSEIYIQECLFKVLTQSSTIEEIQAALKSQAKSECFSESQLYSLIPDLLVIFQDQHQMLEIQKLNEEYMLFKSYANLQSKHQTSYILELHLHRVNIHSFIYEARLTLMRYLLKEKTKKSLNTQSNSNIEIESSDQKKSLQDLQNENKPTKEGQIIEDQNPEIEVKPLKIKIKDYFYNQQQIWSSLYEQNSAILSNLFNCETFFNIKKDTIYDYIATKPTFYLAEINQAKCPISTHDITFKLFSQKDSTNHQSQSQSDICTFLTIRKAHFIQEALPEPIEYVTQKSLFHNVEMLSLGLVETNLSKASGREKDLLIHIQTDKSNIQITYGKAWKEIRAEDRLANLSKNEDEQYPMAKAFFLSQTKVQVQNDTVTLLRQVHNVTTRYEKICSFDVKPFVISVQKINNKLFSYCAQGSLCTIMDKQCSKISEVSLMNALGIRWEYKLNYIGDKVLSYVSLSRRSDLVYLTVPAPLDKTQMQLLPLPSGTFHHSLHFNQIEPGLYQINMTVISSQIYHEVTSANYQIIPTFYKTVKPYRYQPQPFFLDSTYQSFSRFKENYLDYILGGVIKEEFYKFYFPDIPKTKSQKPLKLLNIMNNTGFNKFFSDCIYDAQKGLITFRKNWKGCKVVLKTSSLMLSQSTIIPPDNTTINTQNVDQNTLSQDQNSKVDDDSSNSHQIPQKSIQTLERQIYEIFSNSGTGKNLLIVCSAPRSSPAYSKCRVTAIDITQNFRDWNRNAKFFLQGGKYFQLYFFNLKFLTQSNEDSFLELLEHLARQQFPLQDQSKQAQLLATLSQLKSYKIHYPKPQQTSDIFISLIDYQKQQLQGILKILLIAVCILFPALTICCCVVFFKSNFQNILIYYGVMNVQPSFRYPLNNLALKIKMKELTENKYVKVHKNVRTPQVGDEISSNSEVKYSAECCFCLEELKIQEEVAELYCKHEFHSRCFIDWVKSEPNTKCPLCKRAFTKTALSQFNSRLNSTPSPTRTVQQFSLENETENNFSNEIEIEFQS